MDHYITGAAIKTLRERRGLTQSQLAEQLCVSDKTVSKWETARGLPDITLLEPPAAGATESCTGTATGTDYLSKRYNKSERPIIGCSLLFYGRGPGMPGPYTRYSFTLPPRPPGICKSAACIPRTGPGARTVPYSRQTAWRVWQQR